MRQSYFTMEMYPEEARLVAWKNALAKVALSVRKLELTVDTFGTAISIVTNKGLTFTRIAACAQQISFDRNSDDAVWVGAILSGRATIANEATSLNLGLGDIVYGRFDKEVSLHIKENCQILFVKVPSPIIKARLISPQVPHVAKFATERGIGHVTFGLLAAFAETIGKVEADEIWSIEISTVELLASILVSAALKEPLTGSSTTTTANLYRISQVIETQLANPDLAPCHIAEGCGISIHYLQKLFRAAGTSFRQTVRKRRLERCRADLTNPMYAHLSISDIAFRWGFNDAAHFSRTFHEEWGISPRECRRSGGADGARPPRRFQRGWADGEEELLAAGGMLSGRGIVQPHQLDFRDATVTALPRKSRPPAMSTDVNDGKPRHHYLAASTETIHRGFFSKILKPVLEINSCDIVTIETLSPFSSGIEGIIRGSTSGAPAFGYGQGARLQICTGPIGVRDAMPGDVIELRIRDIQPRADKESAGSYGVNAAVRWGFQYNQLLNEPKRREIITIYRVDGVDPGAHVRAVRSFPVDLMGVDRHDEGGSCSEAFKRVAVPVRPHFGIVGLAPKEANVVDSVPPAYFGGNLDNWRVGRGASVYLPVSVPSGLLSIGDPHIAQGDGQISGTAIEYSLTGDFEIVLHKKQDTDRKLRDLNYPLIETPEEWVIHGFSFPNYLAELGDKARSNVYRTSSLDFAMEDAFRKTRRFLLQVTGLNEDEAISLMSVAVDFGITQVVNGNWCVHAIVRRSLFDH